ncbi:hypothetical protein T283_00040 [Listeria monocytogenes N53-1]|nr:hypothetical protein M643_12690 [Listeria monocytogenes]AHJ05808.1 hypothetical protein AX10_10915 [Listeria monocytogenes WSLC1001]EUJ18887.1 hypothetical protein G161_11341 [Listeria monocytogenes FSL F6-684]EZH71229.1 hypothetical protein T283_00040 [Listeria monocytogenes N53-1]KHK07203.1 hypothetical protein I794_10915 [Listeria monocytogenes SHL002]KHK07652.1 hypothetical protein I612_04405 [Listeria monocytogenes SHL004]KHK15623.1 hypothetical protein I613_04667 [Listeria monocytoge
MASAPFRLFGLIVSQVGLELLGKAWERLVLYYLLE